MSQFKKIILLSSVVITSSYAAYSQSIQYGGKPPANNTNNGNSNNTTSLNSYRPPTVPKSVAYAGEKVPMDRFEVMERLDRELLTNSFMHTATFYILKLKPRYFPVIERILKEEGIPDDFKYLCVAESALQNVRSSAGAEGMWQFLNATAKQYGMEVNENVDERYHLEKATRAACKYLKEAKAKFGSWTAAAASYNCGMGGYANFSNYQGSNHYYDLLLPEETNRYVFRIIALKLILENPAQYGFNISASDTYPPFKTKKVIVTETIIDLASWAKSQGSSYKMIRLVNPWIKGKSIPNKSGKSYTIEVPIN